MAAVGLPAPDLRSLVERMSELVGKGERVALPRGESLVTWRDPSGAALSIFLGPNQGIQGVLPDYTSARRNRVIPREFEPDPDFAFYDRLVVTVLDRRNQGKLELTLLVQDLAVARDRIQLGIPANMAITVLLHTWAPVATDSASGFPALDGQTGLVPLSSPDQPAASYMGVRAHVVRVDEPLNRESRVAFQHANIKVAGIELDALVPEPDREDSPRLAQDRLLEGTCTLVATVDPSRLDATMASVRR